MNDLTLSTEPDAVCSQYVGDRLRQYNDAHSSAFTLTNQTGPSSVEMYLLVSYVKFYTYLIAFRYLR